MIRASGLSRKAPPGGRSFLYNRRKAGRAIIIRIIAGGAQKLKLRKRTNAGQPPWNGVATHPCGDTLDFSIRKEDGGDERNPAVKIVYSRVLWPAASLRAAFVRMNAVDVSPATVAEICTTLRRLNGDETHQGRHIRLPPGAVTIHRVKLYRY